MKESLLTSETFVKKATSISDNIAGKYLQSAILEAQETGLKGIYGDRLFRKVKELVKTEEIELDSNANYKELLDNSQYYLAYMAVIEVTNKVSYKIGNFGVAKSNDENLQVATYEDIVKMQYYYQSKADAFCLDLQHWILEHRSSFPELTTAHCNKISSNLHSAASCGIWLGGARGKRRIGR